MGMLEQVFSDYWMSFLTKLAQIREEMLESGNLFSSSWVPPLYHVRMDTLYGYHIQYEHKKIYKTNKINLTEEWNSKIT